jgi:hypothetical protein
MSNYEWEDDDDFDGASNEPNAMKELRKAYKAMQKQNKELAEQLDSFKSSMRERSVKDVIASKGLPAKVAALIPKDATTADEVEAWLSEYGEVFGVQSQASGEQQPATPSPELQAMSRIAATQSTGESFTGDPDQLDALIRAAQTPEELNKILFGATSGPQVV